MALQKTLNVEKFGATLTFADAYLSLQNVQLTQMEVDKIVAGAKVIREDGTVERQVLWVATAVLMCFASRRAKYGRELPFETVPVKSVFDTAVQKDIFAFLYGEVLKNPTFAGALSV